MSHTLLCGEFVSDRERDRYTYIHISACTYIYVHIYIVTCHVTHTLLCGEFVSDRERERYTFIHIYVCTYKCMHIYIVKRHVTQKIVTTRNVRTTIRTRLHMHIYIHRQTPHTWMSHASRHPPKKSNDSPAKKRVGKKNHDLCPCIPQIGTCSATNTTRICSFIPNTRICSTNPRVDKLLECVF